MTAGQSSVFPKDKYVALKEPHPNDFSEGHVRDAGYELLQLLSNIFEKPLNKKNLRRFLEKQNSISFKDCKNFLNGNKITYSYYDNTSSPSQESEAQSKEYQDAKYQVQIETAKKLKNKGLSNVEIAEILEIEIEELDKYLH